MRTEVLGLLGLMYRSRFAKLDLLCPAPRPLIRNATLIFLLLLKVIYFDIVLS